MIINIYQNATAPNIYKTMIVGMNDSNLVHMPMNSPHSYNNDFDVDLVYEILNLLNNHFELEILDYNMNNFI